MHLRDMFNTGEPLIIVHLFKTDPGKTSYVEPAGGCAQVSTTWHTQLTGAAYYWGRPGISD